jgi:hypothetical protein
MQETKICAGCKLEITDKVMPTFSICGSDNINRTQCWQKCWDCQLAICQNCTIRHNKCRGTFCSNCFQNHKYVEMEKTQECVGCKETKTLVVYDNVCGFKWSTEKLHWIEDEENGVELCESCYDQQIKELNK